MKLLRSPLSLLAILLFIIIPTQAQDQTDSNKVEITYISARTLCPGYKIDMRIVHNIANLNEIIDSIQHVEPNSFPLISQWCRQQHMRIRQLVNSLNTDYARQGEIIWLDSTHCINDAATVISRLENIDKTLVDVADQYEGMEQERLEQERLEAEKRAQQEAFRIQQELNQRMDSYKDTIRRLNTEITTICDGRGVTDKATRKVYQDFFLAYRSVYNRYVLSTDNPTDNYFRELDQLKQFQKDVIDSLLGPNSFRNRIITFPNKLHLRAGKNHNDVYKSFKRVMSKFNNPVNFNNLAEYHEYIKLQQSVIFVQQSYLTAIDLRDTISRNTNTLQVKCGKKHKDIYNSYTTLLGETSLIPSYTTQPDAESFISSLRLFIKMQDEYSKAVDRVDAIQTRSDSIIAACPKTISDLAASYKLLLSTTPLVPNFINEASAIQYNASLDDFEQVQRLYSQIIGIRLSIVQSTDKINSASGAPKGLKAGYKQMMQYTDFSPHFNDQSGGKEFINLMNHFIDVQNKFITIIDNNVNIDNTTKKFKSSFKGFSNISKAYDRLLKSYNREIQILSEADVNTAINLQNEILYMQSKFEEISASIEREQYNNRLKGVKEPDNIKRIMGITVD